MTMELATQQVWEVIDDNIFAVIGMVTQKNEARTVGVNYTVCDRRLYIGTSKNAWKVRHVQHNPHVSLTIPVHKGIPLMPWIKIPPAGVTFHGRAEVIALDEAPPGVLHALYGGATGGTHDMSDLCLIEVTPEKDFITYGIGVSLLQMRDPVQARGRAPVGTIINNQRTIENG